MQVKWVLSVLVGVALLSACGDGAASGSSSTAVNLNSTSFATLAPTLSTVPPSTTLPTEGQVSAAAQEYTVVAGDSLEDFYSPQRLNSNPSQTALVRAANMRESTQYLHYDLARSAAPQLPASPHSAIANINSPAELSSDFLK